MSSNDKDNNSQASLATPAAPVAEMEDGSFHESISNASLSNSKGQSTTIGGSSSRNGSEENEEGANAIRAALSKEQSQNVFRSRALVIAVLAIACGILATVFYNLSIQSETDNFESQYDGAAEKVIDSFEDIMDGMGGVAGLGMQYASSEQEWPFVSLKDYYQMASHASHLSGALALATYPVVREQDFEAWNSYATNTSNQGWIFSDLAHREHEDDHGDEHGDEDHDDHGDDHHDDHRLRKLSADSDHHEDEHHEEDHHEDEHHEEDHHNEVDDHHDEHEEAGSKFNASAPVKPMHYFEIEDAIEKGIQSIPEQPGDSIYLPLWQTSPYVSGDLVNFNLLRDDYSKGAALHAIDSGRIVVNGFLDAPPGNSDSPHPTTALLATYDELKHGGTDHHHHNHGTVDGPSYGGDPMSYMFLPIFDSLEAGRKVVGVLTALVHWLDAFTSILPDSVPPIVIVLEYECAGGFVHDHESHAHEEEEEGHDDHGHDDHAEEAASKQESHGHEEEQGHDAHDHDEHVGETDAHSDEHVEHSDIAHSEEHAHETDAHLQELETHLDEHNDHGGEQAEGEEHHAHLRRRLEDDYQEGEGTEHNATETETSSTGDHAEVAHHEGEDHDESEAHHASTGDHAIDMEEDSHHDADHATEADHGTGTDDNHDEEAHHEGEIHETTEQDSGLEGENHHDDEDLEEVHHEGETHETDEHGSELEGGNHEDHEEAHHEGETHETAEHDNEVQGGDHHGAEEHEQAHYEEEIHDAPDHHGELEEDNHHDADDHEDEVHEEAHHEGEIQDTSEHDAELEGEDHQDAEDLQEVHHEGEIHDTDEHDIEVEGGDHHGPDHHEDEDNEEAHHEGEGHGGTEADHTDAEEDDHHHEGEGHEGVDNNQDEEEGHEEHTDGHDEEHRTEEASRESFYSEEVAETSETYFTYRIVGGEVFVVGTGDLHDEKFDKWRRSGQFLSASLDDGTSLGIPIEQRCGYRLDIYPSQEFVDEYITNTPMVITIVIVAVFIFAILMFLIYDRVVDHRQQLILAKATQSTALVASLFPKNVRDRLMEDNDEDTKKSKFNLKDGLRTSTISATGNSIGMGVESAIADLFPNCTVFFADIAGFTAWSSTREPSQVFHLLQSVYQAFDQLAKRRRVFKVETIGDSYVAVTGLPKPQEQHAAIMVRYAWDCLFKMHEVVRSLEVTLGPGTGSLSMRFGLHSGPVTAGVLRGDRARFQLFGDTVNTAARMESTGVTGRIQLSESTANQLRRMGKEKWVVPREDAVKAKGKGVLKTYWAVHIGRQSSTASCTMTDSIEFRNSISDESDQSGNPHRSSVFGVKRRVKDRLVDWVVQLLLEDIRKVVFTRETGNNKRQKKTDLTYFPPEGQTCMKEIKEIIQMPKFDAKKALLQGDDSDFQEVQIDKAVVQELGQFVAAISMMYHDNPFHNFEHACHVTMSVKKLLKRIVAKEIELDSNAAKRSSRAFAMQQLYDFTHGLSSDPLCMLAMTFSALIHDVDHRGISNTTLAAEAPEMAKKYDNKSIAEQNSLDLAWNLLMEDRFATLRACLFESQEELLRFRQLIVNVVLATDIFDPELNGLRKKRWAQAFSNGKGDGDKKEGAVEAVVDSDRRATIVIEHIIQASDVSHTMQHWHIYQKWNRCLFNEMCAAYKAGRFPKDPVLFWYRGEIGFFDNYVIPLAKKLDTCGVFGVSKDEYLNYATQNRAEWADRGEEIVAQWVAELEAESDQCSDTEPEPKKEGNHNNSTSTADESKTDSDSRQSTISSEEFEDDVDKRASRSISIVSVDC